MTTVIQLQKKGLNLSGFASHLFNVLSVNAEATVTEVARFDHPKPQDLAVSDDSWVGLQLRIDPLARAILDPHNLYFGSLLLIGMLSSVFMVLQPGMRNKISDDDFVADDDFNDKYNNVDDYWKYRGVEMNRYSYANALYARQKLFWAVLFGLVICGSLIMTAVTAYMLESRNKKVDDFIAEIVDELRPRFEAEGFNVEYKSRVVTQSIIGHFVPERALHFTNIDDAEVGSSYNNNTYAPPDKSVKKNKEPSFGTINVIVPLGYKPGQVVNVMTPSGLPIMVAVPTGLEPGESFPVKIPAQMYRPRR